MPKSQLRPNPHPAPGYARRAALRARPTMLSMGAGYYEKVLNYGPFAYWPLWEKNGTVAHCLTDPAMDGTYNSDVSGWPPQDGIGDGNSAPFFDGANDVMNGISATLKAGLDGAEGTLMIWARVANAGVWTDGTTRALTYMPDVPDFQESLYMRRNAANNIMRYERVGGGVISRIEPNLGAPTDWMCLAQTWSESADEFKAYYNGAQIGGTVNGLGAWNGDVDEAWLGAATGAPGQVWHGRMAHVALWTYVVPAPTLLQLAEV